MSANGRQVRSFPFEHAPRLDVEPLFAELRSTEPISRVQLPYGGEAWLLTQYEDIRFVLGDRRFGRAPTTLPHIARIQPEPASEGVLMSLDPPEHTRLRKTVVGAFTARQVEAMRPGTRAIAHELLTAMEDAGAPSDLVTSYAVPLSVAVICNLLGVPVDDRPRFSRWSDALLSTTASTATEMSAAADALAAYFAELIERRRIEPSNDLLSELVRIRDEEGERMSEEELVMISRDLLLAGHETTASQITNFTYILLQHPHLWSSLRDNPQLTPCAVEELMRFVSLGSGGFRCRVALEDIMVGGVRVRAGEAVFAPTIAANRDAAVFPEPDRLDLTRTPNPHMGFGHGMHHCLGAQLARMELVVALDSLIARFPSLRLNLPGNELAWKAGMQIRGPVALPVTW
jgi:cytochrome P450